MTTTTIKLNFENTEEQDESIVQIKQKQKVIIISNQKTKNFDTELSTMISNASEPVQLVDDECNYQEWVLAIVFGILLMIIVASTIIYQNSLKK